MRKLLYYCLLPILLWNTVLAQDSGEEGQNTDIPDIDKLVNIPNSPEAQAFTKYGNIPVSLYTGTPNISIPIHNISGRGISLPISLNYDASGIKVEQIATWVGLGWNLNVGGVVTRQAHGLPDDVISSSPTPYTPYYLLGEDFDFYYNNHFTEGARFLSGQVIDYMQHVYEDQAKQKVDTQPDIFSFNVNGLSGTAFIDYDSDSAFCIEHPEILIQPAFTIGATAPEGGFHKVITSWKIVDAQGNEYTFGKAEETTTQSSASGFEEQWRIYNSAWYLTEIKSANDRDYVQFSYTTPVDWETPQLAKRGETRKQATDLLACNSANSGAAFSKYTIKQFELTQININGEIAAKFIHSQNNRTDLKGKKSLDKIEIYHSGNLLKTYDLVHSYFGTEDTEDEFKSRLKLDELHYYGSDLNETPQKHLFEYYGNSADMPKRDSFGQDFWGYYNGKDGNTTLIPFMDGIDDQPQNAFVGADREASLSHAQIGTLKKITYPTGGFTELTYQLNNVVQQSGGSSNTEIEVIESVTLQGGTNGATTFYTGCNDEFSVPNSNGHEAVFYMGQSGYVTVDYTITDSNPGSGLPTNLAFAAIYPTPTSAETRDYCVLPSGSLFEDTNLPFKNDDNVPISISQTIWLEAGYYGYMVLNAEAEWSSVFTISREVVIDVPGAENTVNVGGLRVNKIISKADVNEAPITKYYFYDDLSKYNMVEVVNNPFANEHEWGSTFFENNLFTSGIQHTPLIFTSANYEEQLPDNGGSSQACEHYTLRHGNNLVYSHGPDVAYSAVTEISFSNNERVGYTVHEFYNTPSSGIVGVPYLTKNLISGKVKRKRDFKYQDGSDICIQQNQSFFTQHSLDKYKVGYYMTSNSRERKSIKVIYDTNEQREYFTYGNLSGTVSGGQLPPSGCGGVLEGEVHCVPGPVSIYEKKPFGIFQQWVSMDKEINTTYFDQTEPVVVTTQYFYDNTEHRQVTKTITQNSKGEDLITEMIYPHDVISLDTEAESARQTMKTKHMLTPVLQKTVSRKKENTTTVLSRVRNNFKLDGDKVRQRDIMLAPDGSLLETRANYTSYDSWGNILEYSKEDDIPISFMWSYNNQLPIAKIINAHQNEAFYTGFESFENLITGNWQYNSAQVIDLPNSETKRKVYQFDFPVDAQGDMIPSVETITKTGLNTDQTYTLTFWAKGGSPIAVNGVDYALTSEWQFFKLPVTASTEVIIKTSDNVSGDENATICVDELRLHPKDAQMTTYTYDPGIGVTSICDANGQSTYFKYDSFGRLVIVRDHQGNILKKHEYQVAGN